MSATQLVFLCDLGEDQDLDRDAWYDVTFYIANQKVFTVESLAEDELPARLPEMDFEQFQDADYQPNLGYGNNVRISTV